MIEKQKKVAQIVEMIHTASLVHDDMIDAADSRRNKSSVNKVWGPRKVTKVNIFETFSLFFLNNSFFIVDRSG